MFRFGKLFQQYAVDAYCRIEAGRLRWVRMNQKTIRAEVYSGLQDAIANDLNLAKIGKRVILPSSVSGSPRHQHQLYSDAMAVVRDLGKPSFFITFTCNPKWTEIVEVAEETDSSRREDIINRVFRQKLKELIHDLTQKNVFGETIGYIYVVEFQNRGLPRAHILIILHPRDRPRTTEDYDKFVRADVPNPITEKELYNIVKAHNIHGPCG